MALILNQTSKDVTRNLIVGEQEVKGGEDQQKCCMQ